MGVEPAKDSGVWGAFAKLIQEGAKLFGDKTAVAVLEEGEDHTLRDYRKLVEEPDEVIQNTIRELLPKQEGTHEIMATLKRSIN
jgi:ribosomal protein L13